MAEAAKRSEIAFRHLSQAIDDFDRLFSEAREQAEARRQGAAS